MKKKIWLLVVLLVLSISTIQSWSAETVVALPTQTLQPTDTLVQTETIDPKPVCLPARGEGTISPAVSIYSITFIVNGVEQVVRDGDTLEAMVGDEMEVREVIICVGSFSGNGGEACVDFAPVDQSGQEIISEHAGTHMVQVNTGFISISGPSNMWNLTESWGQISAVLNHWTQEETENVDCANRRCEHDDWAIIELR